jgi:catechol 2,3-dioxygenase-like lactoylglutathione lyase family enzyme
MKRMHLHVGVSDIDASVSFYSALFAAEPTVRKSDYAKWMLEDPRVNFAISSDGHAALGVEHLGIQVEDQNELGEVYSRLKAANGPIIEEGATTCCYAKSEKSWIADPDGVIWEAFLTQGESTVYGDGLALDKLVSANAADGACCSPATPQGICCDAKPELAVDAPCCGAAV